jgi:hypothetical protein
MESFVNVQTLRRTDCFTPTRRPQKGFKKRPYVNVHGMSLLSLGRFLKHLTKHTWFLFRGFSRMDSVRATCRVLATLLRIDARALPCAVGLVQVTRGGSAARGSGRALSRFAAGRQRRRGAEVKGSSSDEESGDSESPSAESERGRSGDY